MNQKMKSAIEKITLNDVTFSNEVIDPTYVNFFYGKNGAGKHSRSTMNTYSGKMDGYQQIMMFLCMTRIL